VNVLFVDQYSQMGGAQRCLLDLLPAVRDRKWNCSAALPDAGPLAAELAALGVPVETIPCGPYSYGAKTLADYARFLLDTPQAMSRLKRIVRDRAIDLVYANGPRVLTAASLCGAPLLFHAHSLLTRGHDLRLVKRAVRNATVVAASEFVAQSLRPFSAPRVVPNGTDDLGFRPWRGGSPLRIGVVGRIAPEKGQLEFVEAVRILHRQGAAFRYVICGEAMMADPAYAQEVRRRAADLPIEFSGWRATPGEALRLVDVLVVPSGPNEAFSRVVPEAFSAGVPVVAFASGGIPELITDGETGFLVAERSASALAARLCEEPSSPEGFEEVVTTARRLWESSYTVERSRNQLLALMEETFLRSRSRTTAADPSPIE